MVTTYGLDERFEEAYWTGERIKKIKETLLSFTDKFYRGNEDTYKNLRLGFVQGMFETVVSRSSIFYYLQFESYVGEIWGYDVATYWSHMLFHAMYEDLKSLDVLGRMPVSKAEYKLEKLREILGSRVLEVKNKRIEAPLKNILIDSVLSQRFRPGTGFSMREDYNNFFYGRPTYFGGNKKWTVSYYDCALSRWLCGEDASFNQLLGVYLAENTELAILAIIDDVETGNWKKWADVNMGDAERAGYVYAQLKQQMRDVDYSLIGIGESPVFRLPLFGI